MDGQASHRQVENEGRAQLDGLTRVDEWGRWFKHSGGTVFRFAVALIRSEQSDLYAVIIESNAARLGLASFLLQRLRDFSSRCSAIVPFHI